MLICMYMYIAENSGFHLGQKAKRNLGDDLRKLPIKEYCNVLNMNIYFYSLQDVK